MLGLRLDRTERNVYRRNELSAKGWGGMTVQERAEWLGDPLATKGANLLPPGPYYSGAVDVKQRENEIIATATAGGVYLYSICIVGEASNFVSKTLTLSVGSVTAPAGSTPQIAVWWHDDSGLEYAGASMSVAGSMTFNTADFPNVGNRQSLAIYLYVTTAAEVASGAEVHFRDVMLEVGDTPHPWVPYTEIVATEATKGAYNYSDLNRVERVVADISDRAGLGLVTKTDWRMWDVPDVAEMTRYINNIKAIKTHYGIGTSIPADMSHLDYEGANSIERVLLEAYTKATMG